MELRQLKYLCKVTEFQSFSEAARELNVTQSTLSQQIRALEGELGVSLLIRDSHHVRLTDMGEAFLPSARRTIAEAAACINRIHDVQQLHTGSINIGCTYTFAPLLMETVLDYMKKFPNVKLNIICKSMEDLMVLLEKDEIDVALSFKPSQSFSNVESHVIFSGHLAVVVSDTHPLAGAKTLRLADIESYPLALPARGLQARNTFERMIEGLDRQFNVRLEINDLSVLLSIVKSSKLVTLLSGSAISRESGITAIPLDCNNSEMEGAFNLHKGTYVKGTTREFLKLLCDNRSYGMAMMDLALI